MIAPWIRILAIAVLCVASLIGLVLRENAARAQGVEIVMPMEAVDPRSLLSGHYVIINLADVLAPGEACPPELSRADQRWRGEQASSDAWVGLAQFDGHHRAVIVSPTRDGALAAAPLAARGNAFCISFEGPQADGESTPPAASIISELGVTRFHTSQSEAQRIESVLREDVRSTEGRVAAILSIGADGRARLLGLLVDGERVELGWR